MKDNQDFGLFDGEDVDVGEEPPDGDDLTPEEVDGIHASQQDPASPPLDAEGN